MKLLRLLLAAMLGLAAADDSVYKAAVYEHIRVGAFGGSSWEEFVTENLAVFDTVAQLASSKGVDLLVFPEYGIIPSNKYRETLLKELETIPPPGVNPCMEESKNELSILLILSCMARQYGLVIVANTGSRQPCNLQDDPWCPAERNAYIFNTNVVLDRQGKLIARYFKHHLFFENGFDEPPLPYRNVSIFETEFGTFGTFICFDMLYPESVELVEKHGVVNVVYPTWWYDQLPALHALKVQMSWAYHFRVNVLSANVHYPFSGSIGSGIFSGVRGELISTHAVDGYSRLLISDVPRDPRHVVDNATFNTEEIQLEYNGTDFFKKYHWRHTNLQKYSIVRLVKDSDHIEACNNFLCCSVQYKTAGQLNDTYVLAVFNGIHVLKHRYKIWEQNCIVSTFTGTLPNARYPLESHTAFENLTIQGNFSTPYVFPGVMHSGHRMASTSLWDVPQVGKLTYSDPSASLPVLNAVLYARDYSKDPIATFKKSTISI